MLYHRYFHALGLHYVRATDPFSLTELFSFIVTQSEATPESAGLPVLLDFRSVSLTGLDSAEIRRHMMKKSALDPRLTHVACAYLVKSDADHAMVRMANVFSELSGGNPESQSFVTENLGDALYWLADRVGPMDADALEELYQTAASR